MKTTRKQGMKMITADGGLKVTVGSEDVTWFRFLQASRTTNSLEGGWNSKSHWGEMLNSLGCKDGGFLEQWTENSLANGQTPAPREEQFMFQRDLSTRRGPLMEGEPLRKGTSLADLSENEINARLFNDAAHGLWGKSIGYEIPLARESVGQLKVDIIAIGKDGCSLEIIELKQATNTGDSPLMALTEAICYGIQAVRCRGSILNDLKEPSMSTEHFGRIRLMLVAPRQYWEHWKWKRELAEPMRNIIASVNKALAKKDAQLLFEEGSICCLEDALPPR